jgi:hypothetical protein
VLDPVVIGVQRLVASIAQVAGLSPLESQPLPAGSSASCDGRSMWWSSVSSRLPCDRTSGTCGSQADQERPAADRRRHPAYVATGRCGDRRGFG